MNSIYNTAAAAVQHYMSGANHQSHDQQERDHPQQQRQPGNSPTRLRGISRSIRAILNEGLFKPARKNDSVQDITDKLQFIISEIRERTEGHSISTAEVWSDIWAVIGRFITSELEDSRIRTDTIREIFPLLTTTIHIEPLDLQGWLSSDWAPQIAQKIWTVHNKPHSGPPPAAQPQHDTEAIKVRQGDSIETFRSKVKALSDVLRSNTYHNHFDRTQHIKDMVRYILAYQHGFAKQVQSTFSYPPYLNALSSCCPIP